MILKICLSPDGEGKNTPKLEEVARTYVASVELEERMRTEAPALLDEISELRADLHALLMNCLRENDIRFADRAEAAQIAFQITQKAALHQ